MTKILVTIGPASTNSELITEFARHTKLFRLNGSHNTLEWHKDIVSKIRKLVPDAFILLDIPGAKPRTSNIEPISIKKGQNVVFGSPQIRCEELVVGLTKPLPASDKNYQHNFSINDGQYLFDIIDVKDSHVVGRSRGDFLLLPRKGVNLPGSVYDEALQLQICRDFIGSVADLDVNGFGLSFIQSGNVLDALRDITKNKVLVSKIENSEGLINAPSIIARSDAVMIDRGDLAAEIGFSALYNAVEKISRDTKLNGKPLIMATENLESMAGRDTPSKSEVMSLAHSVSIGADCIMLSEETATADNGQYIVKWLTGFLEQANIQVNTFKTSTQNKKYEMVWDFVSGLRDTSVLLMSKSGYALYSYMAIGGRQSVSIVTNNPRISDVAKLFSVKITVINSNLGDAVPIETIWEVVKNNKTDLFSGSDHLVAIYVSKYVSGARANSITVFHKSDFLT
jgi:pyruvate kinase